MRNTLYCILVLTFLMCYSKKCIENPMWFKIPFSYFITTSMLFALGFFISLFWVKIGWWR